MILGESSSSSHTLVEILLHHKIFGYSRRILQAGKSPQLGETMLQGLNSTLQEKRHELSTPKVHLLYHPSTLGCGLEAA
jgi:hypothetical protein